MTNQAGGWRQPGFRSTRMMMSSVPSLSGIPKRGLLASSPGSRAGAPGQRVLSPTSGANGLMAAVPNGELTTEPTSGRAGLLASSGAITDGAWHHVGLVRDGSERILYVDGIEIARDKIVALTRSSGAPQIGAGKGLEPGIFWTGLIDDIRIYNRVVKP